MENHSFIKFVPGVYVIYLSVPKVASSSVSYAMLNTQPTAQPKMSEHSPEGKALTNWRPIESLYPALPIFTFTRHPIEKFLSYYKDKFVRARDKGFELDHLKKLKFDPDMSLEEVVRYMMTIPVEKMEHHAQPQHRILIKKGHLIPDFVAKVEDMSSEWPLVSEVSLCNFMIEQKKNTTEGRGESLELTDPVVSALTSYYATDFELFGYDKPLIKDDSIKVVRSDTDLSISQIDTFKSEILDRREMFRTLADRLNNDQVFRENYLSSKKSEFNRFVVYSNHINSKSPSSITRFKKVIKSKLS